jgi:AsmA protein
MEKPYVEGQIDGHVDLRGRGHSLREMAANLDGEVALVFGGGTLRGFAINKLAANLIGQMFGADDLGATPLNCAVDHLEVVNGLATVKVLLIDSKVSTIAGTGTIDLRNEQIDLLFTPKPKIPKLARIKTPVSVRGNLAHPTVTVEAGRSFLKQGVMAIGLGILNPFAAVIPFVSPGSLDHHPCAEFLKTPEGESPSRPAENP